MPLTKEAALAATNPADSDEVREASAIRLQLGQAANEIFWASRSELEKLWAQVNGHGVVARAVEDVADAVTGVEAAAQAAQGATVPAIESTAEDVPDAEVVPPDAATAATAAPASAPSPTVADPAAAPTNSAATVSQLRAQLVAAGITPEA